MEVYKCSKCGIELNGSEAYEYRGAISCDKHFDEVIEARDFQRQEIINEEYNKTRVLKGLDLDPSGPVGRANNQILSRQIEIASKESGRLKEYEGR